MWCLCINFSLSADRDRTCTFQDVWQRSFAVTICIEDGVLHDQHVRWCEEFQYRTHRRVLMDRYLYACNLNAKWFSWGTSGSSMGTYSMFQSCGCDVHVGLILIIWHDKILRDLRPCPGESDIAFPRVTLDYATLLYTAELIAWFGFWAMSCVQTVLSFSSYPLNLVPRSIVTHNWYLPN